MKAQQVIKILDLKPHPEGGYYRETFRSQGLIKFPDYERERNFSTAIYFLLTEDSFSACHRVKQDEVWHFYAGAPVVMHVFFDSPIGYKEFNLGITLESGQQPQVVVPGFSIQAAESTGDWSLLGCTVAPGFDYKDFELIQPSELLKKFPEQTALIQRLCRKK